MSETKNTEIEATTAAAEGEAGEGVEVEELDLGALDEVAGGVRHHRHHGHHHGHAHAHAHNTHGHHTHGHRHAHAHNTHGHHTHGHHHGHAVPHLPDILKK